MQALTRTLPMAVEPKGAERYRNVRPPRLRGDYSLFHTAGNPFANAVSLFVFTLQNFDRRHTRHRQTQSPPRRQRAIVAR